jgi:hypothetical protein
MHRSQTFQPRVSRIAGRVALGLLLAAFALGSAGCELLPGHDLGGAVQLSGVGTGGGDAHQTVGGRSDLRVPGSLGGTFEIRGHVGDLYPGGVLPLHLAVNNTLGAPILLTSIVTRVGGASPACWAANVSVSEFSGNVPIFPGKEVHPTVWVTMAHAATNACQGAVFPFSYHGTARYL